MRYAYLCILCIFFACDSNSSVKIYKHDIEKQGFVRKQNEEFVPYAKANGWFAMSESDMEYILNKLANCKTRDGFQLEQEEIETYLASQGL